MRFGNSSHYFGLKRSSFGKWATQRPLPEAESRKGSLFRALLCELANEGAHESAAPSVRLPIYIEPWPAIGIRDGNRRHRVGQLGERWIESHFVTADMVFVIHGAGLHGSELSGAQQRNSVPLGIDREFHGSWDYLVCVTQKFTSHLVRKRDQR